MKKVVIQLYVIMALLTMMGTTFYAVYEISRMKTEAYLGKRPEAAAAAALISRGRAPELITGNDLLRVELIGKLERRIIYQNGSSLTLLERIASSAYLFPVGSAGKEMELSLRYRLLSNQNFIPPLRMLFITATSILILTGLLIAFMPRKPVLLLLTDNTPVRSDESQPAATNGTACTDDETALFTREHLPLRLESELKRAASFDQDLSLAIITIHEQLSEVDMGRYSTSVQQFFVFRDLCFQYSSAEICIILPNQELDQAIRTMREFKRHLTGLIPESGLRIGVSARGGRLLDSGTMLKEAEAALQKSASDESGAVFGFRADPSKYRARLSGD